MRTSLKMIVLVLAITSCTTYNSPDEKLQERVRRYLSGSLNDPRNYIPLDFKIKELLTGNTPEFQKKSDSLSALMISDRMDFREYLKQDSLLMEQYKAQIMTGWTVNHRFIYKDNTGQLKDSLLTFYLDTCYNIERVQ